MEIKIIASGSSGNSARVSDGKTALLLDAGVSVRKLQGAGLSGIEGCLVTHSHGDHSLAAKDLAKRGIDVFSSGGTLAALGLSGHRFHAVKNNELFKVGTFIIKAFDVVHDDPEPLGYLMLSKITGEKLLWFSDTGLLPRPFAGVTHIIVECNHGDFELRRSVSEGIITPELAKRIAKYHMSVERLVIFLKACDLSRLKEVHLAHLSDNNSDEVRFRREIQRVTGVPVYVH